MNLDEIINSPDYVDWSLKHGYDVQPLEPTGTLITRATPDGPEEMELLDDVDFSAFLEALAASVASDDDRVAGLLKMAEPEQPADSALVL